MTKELNKRLEEAAENYAEKHGFRVPYDGSNNFYDETDVKASNDGFLAGAEYGYKEAVAQAKEWIRHRNRHACKEWLDKECADFEADMNKLWEEEK